MQSARFGISFLNIFIFYCERNCLRFRYRFATILTCWHCWCFSVCFYRYGFVLKKLGKKIIVSRNAANLSTHYSSPLDITQHSALAHYADTDLFVATTALKTVTKLQFSHCFLAQTHQNLVRRLEQPSVRQFVRYRKTAAARIAL